MLKFPINNERETMAETHVLSALTQKRAEVSGEIKHYENLLKKSKLNLQSIDQIFLIPNLSIMETGINIKS